MPFLIVTYIKWLLHFTVILLSKQDVQNSCLHLSKYVLYFLFTIAYKCVLTGDKQSAKAKKLSWKDTGKGQNSNSLCMSKNMICPFGQMDLLWLPVHMKLLVDHSMNLSFFLYQKYFFIFSVSITLMPIPRHVVK